MVPLTALLRLENGTATDIACCMGWLYLIAQEGSSDLAEEMNGILVPITSHLFTYY